MTTASPLHTGSRFSGTELDLPSSWAAGARAAENRRVILSGADRPACSATLSVSPRPNRGMIGIGGGYGQHRVEARVCE